MYGKKYNLFNWTKPMVILLMISGSHQKQQQWQQHTKTQTNKTQFSDWEHACWAVVGEKKYAPLCEATKILELFVITIGQL